MSQGTRVLVIASALGCGIMAGVFFSFSAFVMNGLSRLPSARGLGAMQSINIAAVRPAFMTAMFGTAAGCVALSVIAVRSWGGRPAALLIAGSALYLVGAIGLTIVYHVPLNDALAGLDPDSVGAAAQWSDYLQGWTRWNHVRAATALAAAAMFTGSLIA
jgi:uncharacterized membrane protein